jgi:hypothetical protein
MGQKRKLKMKNVSEPSFLPVNMHSGHSFELYNSRGAWDVSTTQTYARKALHTATYTAEDIVLVFILITCDYVLFALSELKKTDYNVTWHHK